MKSSLVLLAVLPLAFSMAACEGPPEGEGIGEVAGAQTIFQPPITNKIPVQQFSYSALIDFDSSPGGAVATGSVVDATYAGT